MTGAEGPDRPPRDSDRRDDRTTEADRAADIVAGMGDATWLRGVAAVILGFAVLTLGSVAAGRAVIALTGVGPGESATPLFVAANLGARFLLAAVAGVLTAKAAPRAPLVHAAALAGVLTLFSLAAIAGLRAGGQVGDPAWYPTVMLFVGPGGVLAGGFLLSWGRVRAVR